ncbi:TPA: hypothetical protein ACWK5U_005068, partial [Escherichia coli]
MGSCAAPSAKGDDKFITTDYLQQCRFLDAGDDPHGATAVDAGGDVDGKDPLEALRPAHRTAL